MYLSHQHKKKWTYLFLITTLFLVQSVFAQNDVVKISTKAKSIIIKQGETFSIDLDIIINSGWHINSNKPNDDFLIRSEITANGKGIVLSGVKYPQAHNLKLAFSEEPVSVYEKTVIAKLNFKANKNIPIGIQKVLVTLDYQACNDVSCMPPNSTATEFEIEVSEKEESSTTSMDSTVTEVLPDFNVIQEVSKTEKSDGTIASTLESSGLLLSLIFIFLAGLALNLTTCVYPLIPITIGYFGGQAEGKTSRLVMLGLLYMLGMALTYSVVGVVTSLSGAVFGTLLQNPIVIIGIAILFVVLALSQFGVYEFKLPDSWVAKAGGAKGGGF